MNLPRHTLTSHAPFPTFVNARFSTVTDRRGQEEGSSSSNASYDANGVKLSQKEGDAMEDSGQGRRKTKEGRKVEPVRWNTDRVEAAADGDSAVRETSMFACATRQGFFVARTHPLSVVVRRGER